MCHYTTKNQSNCQLALPFEYVAEQNICSIHKKCKKVDMILLLDSFHGKLPFCIEIEKMKNPRTYRPPKIDSEGTYVFVYAKKSSYLKIGNFPLNKCFFRKSKICLKFTQNDTKTPLNIDRIT